MADETTKVMMTASKLMAAGKTVRIPRTINVANKSPNKPPNTDKITDSVRN